ncbi:MAG: hypothetical protein AseanaTS_20270 [Candidatus Pelagadaptatus aseana]|uniref:FimV/HubP family polar landmark protein n=1 Tax=Candidatus Pelagadaptatus aseana TaxID=3120508 RepID=UPI0039B2F7D5
MRLRKLALAVGLAGALSAEMASALGLGEIKLNSDLNEPLDAEIKLLQTRELTDSEILVSLASKDDFRNSGVERIFFLNDLKFKVDLNSPRGAVVRVTSKKPVREPYLNFLIQTQWPNGRILREYTLLMDLPVFSQDTAKPVVRAAAAPKPKASQPQPAPAPRTPEPAKVESKPEPRQAAAEPRASKSYGSDSYGPVKISDTLWEIALKVRPDNSFSVQQTMLAIQRINPEAFIRGNINLLRKGQVLRVPSADDIRSMSAREAISQVAVQNNAWEGAASVAGPQLDASKPVAQSRPQAEKVEGRLTLASSSATDSSGNGQMGSGGDGADTEALQNELAISLEELDKASRENKELKERIDELEDQISTMERLIEVSNQEMRALQLASEQKAQAEEAVAAADDALQQADAAEGVVAEDSALLEEGADDSEASTETVSAEEDQIAVTEPEMSAQEQAEVAQPVVTPQTQVIPQPKTGLMDTIMANIQLVAAGAAALLLALFLILRRRKSEDEDVALESLDSTTASEMDDSFDSGEEIGSAEDFASDDMGEDLDLDVDQEDLSEDDGVTGSETGDAVAEADIYIAYGKFDQAEEMLVKAIDEGDAGVDAHLKLLEVYAESDNLDKFDRQYATVLGLGDDSAATRAAELRQHFADAPEFDASALELDQAESAEAELAETEGDQGLDFDFGELEAAEDTAVDAGQEETETFDFDLDLDEDLKLDSETAEAGDGLPDLDFDFDSGTEADAGTDVAQSDEFELNLDSDGALELESLDLELGESAVTDSESAVLDLDLDLDLESEIEGMDGGSVEDAGPSQEAEFNEGFALDVDALSEIDDQGVELDLDLDEGSLEVATDEEPGLDAISLDLEEATAVSEAENADAEPADEFQSFDLSGDALEPDVPEDSEEADFDLELGGDVDLASLDEDLEALSGELEASEDEVPEAELEVPEADLDGDLDLSSDLDLSLEGDEGAVSDDLDVAVELDTSFDPDADVSADQALESLAESVAEQHEEAGELSLGEDFDMDISSDLESDLSDIEELSVESDTESDDIASFDSEQLASESDLSAVEGVDLAAEDLDLGDDSLGLDMSAVDESSDIEAEGVELDQTDDVELDLAADIQSEDGEPETAESLGESADDASATETDLAETEDEVFSQALSDLPDASDLDFSAENLAAGTDGLVAEDELEAELDFLSETDEVSTKLDLARAYIDMGDKEGAKDILDEVVQDGNDEQKQQAEELLSRV